MKLMIHPNQCKMRQNAIHITPVLQNIDKNFFLFNALFPQSLLIIRLEIMVDLGSLRGFMTMKDSRSFRVLLA